MEEKDQTFTAEQVLGIAFTAAGAATGPLLRDHPHYVFPSERVSAAVADVVREHGIDPEDHQGYVVPPLPVDVDDAVHKTTIAAYLDSTIRYWRRVRDGQEPPPNDDVTHAVAVAYVDAYQSARSSLLGSTLEVETAVGG